jgi:hypothetical protein
MRLTPLQAPDPGLAGWNPIPITEEIFTGYKLRDIVAPISPRGQQVLGEGEMSERPFMHTVNPVGFWNTNAGHPASRADGMNLFISTPCGNHEQEKFSTFAGEETEDINLSPESDPQLEDIVRSFSPYRTSPEPPELSTFDYKPCLSPLTPGLDMNYFNVPNLSKAGYKSGLVSSPCSDSISTKFTASADLNSHSSRYRCFSFSEDDGSKKPDHNTNIFEATLSQRSNTRHSTVCNCRNLSSRSVETRTLANNAPNDATLLSPSVQPYESESPEELAETSFEAPHSQDRLHFGSGHFPTPPPPRDPQQVAVDAARRLWEDDFILHGRELKWTFKEIKQKGGFTCAESTLRGRYRALTKTKNERVRRPIWKPRDETLLLDAVRALSSFDRIQRTLTSGDTQVLGVSWQDVAKYIKDKGGSYRFGNSTCKKKWMQLNGILCPHSKD